MNERMKDWQWFWSFDAAQRAQYNCIAHGRTVTEINKDGDRWYFEILN